MITYKLVAGLCYMNLFRFAAEPSELRLGFRTSGAAGFRMFLLEEDGLFHEVTYRLNEEIVTTPFTVHPVTPPTSDVLAEIAQGGSTVTWEDIPVGQPFVGVAAHLTSLSVPQVHIKLPEEVATWVYEKCSVWPWSQFYAGFEQYVPITVDVDIAPPKEVTPASDVDALCMSIYGTTIDELVAWAEQKFKKYVARINGQPEFRVPTHGDDYLALTNKTIPLASYTTQCNHGSYFSGDIAHHVAGTPRERLIFSLK